jgi:hypothetical protein
MRWSGGRRAEELSTRDEKTRDLPKVWLGGRDSNPDSLVQSQLSYH